MFLPWREFNVHLGDLSSYLSANYQNIDGIIATSDGIEIKTTTPLNTNDESSIVQYYNSLNKTDEDAKFSYEANLPMAVREYKRNAIMNNWQTLTLLERKCIFDLELSDADKQTIYNWWSS